ncbi:MAG: alpha/beta hydrolase [Pseudohongiellaceae bacterium]
MKLSKLLPALGLALALSLPVQAATVRDVVYGHKDGMALVMDVYQPEGNHNGAAVAYMISGGWMSSLPMQQAYQSMFLPLVDAGFTVFAVRHGSSPRYQVPNAWSDVSSAFQYIGDHAAEYAIDPAKIGVSGISAGGHLSLMLGLATDDMTHRPAAVVSYMPPVDLRGMTGPNDNFPALDFNSQLAPSVSPLDYASPGDPPVLLIHGDADELVPISNSERMHAALREVGIATEFIVVEGAPHGLFTGEDGKTAAAALLGWFETYLL